MSKRVFGLTAAVLLLPVSAAMASSFSGITAFGDSLTDNGNAFLVSLGTYPGANYGSYTFSNGLTTSFYSDGPNTTPKAAGPAGLWIDQLATKLGVSDPLPEAAGGTNYAVASAQSGTANPQDVGNQVARFTTTNGGSASPTSLYAVWAGANDILNGNNPVTAADSLDASIRTLHGEGAQTFLWLNLPLLGDTPRGSPNMAALNAASAAFDAEWGTDLASLNASGIHVIGVDIEALFSKIVANPGAYGFTNVTSAAQGLSLATDAGYLSWDGLHPTTQGHALVADAAFAALNATASPEPASIALLLAGIAMLAFTIRPRKSGGPRPPAQ